MTGGRRAPRLAVASPWPGAWGDGLPAPEPRARRAAIRGTAVAALLATVGYLGWRITSTVAGATWWLAGVMLAVEIHALLSLTGHAFDLWDLDAGPRPSATRPGDLRVAVLVPTYNESREILLPTVAAAVALQPAHETWVLDDGARPWVAELATRLGAHYRARTDRSHAKAGNINALLPELDVDLIAVFDADHIAHANFLAHTLPYFADPRMALVQTPQDFYNVTSYEHVELSGGRRFSEQELFYRALAAGRNRWNAAFWCGTNAVVRLAALRDVGGVATETVTEDIHTTIRLHRRGWRTAYHNEVLARGLAAGTSAQYLSQRLRWGTGAMQVLRTENPAFVRGLTVGQRISYLSTLLGWFDSWRTLGFLLLPVATVLTGGLPVAAALWTFLPLFLVAFGLQRLALRLLARGRSTLWHAMLFDAARLPANLRATLTLFSRRAQTFSVTAKGRDSSERGRPPAPRLLVGLLAAHLLAFAWYVATALHATGLHYGVPWAAHGSAIWLVGNAAVLVAAIRRIRSPLFGPERRAAVRFDVGGDATIDGRPASLHDVSLTGASLLGPLPDARPGQHVTIVLATAGSVVQLPAVVRSVTALAPVAGRLREPDGGEQLMQVGVEFWKVPEDAAADLALALFRTGVAPRVVPAVGHPLAVGAAA